MLLLKQTITILLMVMFSCLVSSKPTVDYCQTCLDVSEFIQQMEYNQTESIVKENLFKICLKENDGSNTKVCKFLSATMQNTLKRIGDKNFCIKVNACTSGGSIVKPPANNSERCRFCTKLLESFKSLVAESNINLVKESLNNYCELSNDFKDECQKNVNDHLANFIDFLLNKMDSQAFCHAIDSCESEISYEKKLPSIGDLVSLRDPNQIADHLDFIEQQEKLSSVNSNGYKNPITCFVCEQVVSRMYSLLHKNATREHIEKMLAKSCKTIFLRNKVKEHECERKVEKNADIIIRGFVDKVKPHIVCILMGMCFPFQRLPDQEQLNTQAIDFTSRPIQMGQSFECYFCDKVAEFLFKELDQNKTREYIRHLLEKSCSVIFKKDDKESKCEEYVNAYTDKLINLIEKLENPGLICNILHMCPVNATLINEWDEKRLNFVENEFKNSSSIEKNLNFKLNWCEVCEHSYPVLNELAQIDVVKDEIKLLANEFCDSQILPIKECKAKMDKYIDVIVKVNNSDAGCKQLNFCSVQQNLTKLKLKSLSGLECNTCKMLVKDLYQDLDHLIHSDVTKRLINNTCDLIPQDQYKKECKENALKGIEETYDYMTKALPPQQVCELLEYCKHKGVNNYLSNCTVCQTSMVIIDATFNNLFVQETLNSLLESFCDSRKGKFKFTCKNMIKESLPIFYGVIKNLTNHDSGFCVKMGICNSSKLFDNFNVDIFLKNDLLAGVEELIPSENELIDNQYSVSCPKCVCKGCKEVMGLVHEEVLSQRFLKDKILNALLRTCPEKDEECRKFYRKYVNGLYDMIERNTQPRKACEALKLCPHELELLEPLKEEFVPDTNLNEGILCEECKKEMAIVHDKVVSEKELKDRILESLLKTCPKNDEECRKFFRNYVNFLYDMIEKNTHPEKACVALKLCQNDFELFEPVNEKILPAINLNETKICEGCRSAIKYLLVKLNDKFVVDEILKEVEITFCNPLVFLERKACTRFINELGPKIIKHFVSKIDEYKICNKQLKLCPDDLLIDNTSEEINFDLTNFFEDLNCLKCQRSVEKLNNLRGDTDKQFTVEEICKDDLECSEFMFNFRSFFLDNQHNRDPILACTELDVCLIPGKVQLLGGYKCKYGPAYSCQSAAHADACKAKQFCQQNYWQAVEN